MKTAVLILEYNVVRSTSLNFWEIFFFINEVIFINMKTTIILSIKQADMLLTNLPKGHSIKMSVADANRIVNSSKQKQK